MSDEGIVEAYKEEIGPEPKIPEYRPYEYGAESIGLVRRRLKEWFGDDFKLPVYLSVLVPTTVLYQIMGERAPGNEVLWRRSFDRIWNRYKNSSY